MSIVGILFITPFLLFSSIGGLLADRVPKNRIVIVTRFLEFCCLGGALLLFSIPLPYSAYAILFLMASLSAIFGPSKYALIPELVSANKLLFANSIITVFTYLGIIIGTALPSFAIVTQPSNFTLLK